MNKTEKEGTLRRFLKSIPGRRTGASEEEDQGNSYEFEATVGRKGNSLGITFNSVSQALARLREGMKARVIMVREPGTSWYWARVQFLEEERENGSGVST